MIQQLLTLVWWKAASIRGLRTALVVAVPYLPISVLGQVPYLTILSAGALAFVASLFTSVVDIPEAQGQAQTWYFAILSRVTKTVFQAIVAGIGTTVLIQHVDWTSIVQLAITAGFGSLLLAVLKTLPEEAEPHPAPASTINNIVVNPGTPPPDIVYADIVDADIEERTGRHESGL